MSDRGRCLNRLIGGRRTIAGHRFAPRRDRAGHAGVLPCGRCLRTNLRTAARRGRKDTETRREINAERRDQRILSGPGVGGSGDRREHTRCVRVLHAAGRTRTNELIGGTVVVVRRRGARNRNRGAIGRYAGARIVERGCRCEGQPARAGLHRQSRRA